MGKLIERYWKSTPKFYRKLGDTLLVIGTTITGFAIYSEYAWLAIIVMILTVAGKFFTNMFAEEQPE